MDEMRKTDKLFLILHRAGWSIGDTAFVGKGGISWLVYGTNGEHSIRAEGKSQVLIASDESGRSNLSTLIVESRSYFSGIDLP